ncbi:MAG: MBL fold metallo-hydrolase [bacterium]
MGYKIPEKFRPPAARAGPPDTALAVEWAGTAGFRLTYGNNILLIDPFVSRPGLFRMLFLRLYTNEKLCAELFPRADHIFVGHSHYDHLMDVPAVAQRTGATVHGSASTAAVCRGAGLPGEQIHVVAPGDVAECGPVGVKFFQSLHGRAILGRVPMPGEITGEPKPPLRSTQYRLGTVFGFLVEAGGFRVFHLSSAEVVDEEIEKVGSVDLLLLCLAGRKHTEDYLGRTAGRLKPRFLVPHHYDSFFRPIDRDMRLVPGVGMEEFISGAASACPDARILMPAFFEKLAFDVKTGELL